MNIFQNTKRGSSVPVEAQLRSRRVRMFPLLFFQYYLTASVLVFAFGPWPWPVSDPIKLYLFLFFAQAALWFGYKSGLRSGPGGYYGRWQVVSMLKISLVVNLLWIIPSYILTLRQNVFGVDTITTAIVQGINDPGAAYASKLANDMEFEPTILSYISLLIAPVLWLLFPLAVFHWRWLTLRIQICFIFITVAGLMKWVAIGTTKGIADFFLVLLALLLAANPVVIKKINLKIIIKTLSVSLILITLLLGFFTYMQQGRGQGEIPTYNYNAMIDLDKQNMMVYFLLPASAAAVGAITSYFSQGYYGLSLALNESFDWSYGVGNSFFITGLTEHFVGQGVVSEKTYPVKIEKYGWLSQNNWHTFYSWIASDVTFPGTIIVVFLIGRIFAMVWLDVLKRQNPYAVPLYALIVLMLFYFPANNQVLAFAATSTPFLIILVLWTATRKRYVGIVSAIPAECPTRGHRVHRDVHLS